MQLVLIAHGRGATLEVGHVGALVRDDERALTRQRRQQTGCVLGEAVVEIARVRVEHEHLLGRRLHDARMTVADVRDVVVGVEVGGERPAGAAGSALTVSGSGTLRLTAANTYAGSSTGRFPGVTAQTLISQGWITVQNNKALLRQVKAARITIATVGVVGRHNSGKTTFLLSLLPLLVARLLLGAGARPSPRRAGSAG